MDSRKQQIFSVTEIAGFVSWQDTIRKALHWADSFDYFHFFTDNQTGADYPFGGFSTMLAVGARHVLDVRKGQVFNDLQQFIDSYPNDWVVGYLGYDLKNETEDLKSQNPDFLQFSEAGFYVPEHNIFFYAHSIEIISDDPLGILQRIGQAPLPDRFQNFEGIIQSRTPKEVYLKTVERLKEHILDGDSYEINYCVEFFTENAALNPVEAYLALTELSPMPFSVVGKTDACYLLGASPERFLKKTGNRLISMPIKGTARRGFSLEEDTSLKEQLQSSEKERAENMMIVDLVRNDLARSAVPGTVRVEEMFGIYTFAALHQMISTVSAEIRSGVSLVETIRNAFPMGSMTGAPKIKAMELIEQYEDRKRGLYSGAVGYVTPQGDFDFNVIIRSILYNAATQYLSFSVGSAITYDSIAEKEYEECLLKAQTICQALETQRRK